MSESLNGINKMLGLWTKDLRSCLGVLVIGNEDYVLGHFFTAASMLDSQFDKFEQEVEKAKLTNKHGYISIPETTKAAFWNGKDGPENKKLQEDVIALPKEKMTVLTGSEPRVFVRESADLVDPPGACQPHGTFSVDKNGNIESEGRKVT